MPASRSRTEHWWDCLRKIHERGGAIEISVARPGAENGAAQEAGSDVVWRVKVVSLTPEQIVVEQPAAFGRAIDLCPGVALVGAITVGQNRWMFHTRTIGSREDTGGPPGQRCLILAAPAGVERCTRRAFYRISTADLRLPPVQCWPLLDPTSVVAAETANRLQIESLRAAGATTVPPMTGGDAPSPTAPPEPGSLLLPEVGPLFKAALVNISGGGLGLRLDRADAGALERRPHFWLRVDLTPQIPAPVAVTARLAHTHIDSAQNVYAGMAFEFAFNQAHRKFVIDLFTGYIDGLIRSQLRGQAGRVAAA